MPTTRPLLYSLRRCPYCVRARIGLLLAQQPVILREVKLKNKPAAMMHISTQGTVPILQLPTGEIMEESIDIMLWALHRSDPHDLLRHDQPDVLPAMQLLISDCDNNFIPALEAFKHSARYHTATEHIDREACLPFIERLEQGLQTSPYLMGNHPCLADFAILPFIRQFSRVDKPWYRAMAWHNLQRWLIDLYQHPAYGEAMQVVPVWQEGQPDGLFPA
ncbi:glutathione S-transferase [Photobacterium japonica]|uniref:glutathione S-transferase n=1 Tax=Photobacterium japonica TaxID=2910235 RepID=UPI003D12BD57